MRFSLDSWRADYAFPYDSPSLQHPPNAQAVAVDVEAPAHDWCPITPDVPAFATTRFVDGVQTADAVLWIDAGDGTTHPGLAASWAAGVLRCTIDPAATSGSGSVEVEHAEVDRGVFSDAASLAPITAGPLTWHPVGVAAARQPRREDPTAAMPGPGAPMSAEHVASQLRGQLGAARARLEGRLGRRDLEVAVDTLTVYDGLLPRGITPMSAVGLAKRAHRTYLPAHLDRVRRSLAAGQRSPMFAVGDAAAHRTFYLALADPAPPGVADPASCISRVEFTVTPGTPALAATAFADRVAATLPRFASQPHQDARAPQNLLPVRSLEQHLRRLLGDPTLLRPLLAQAAWSAAA